MRARDNSCFVALCNAVGGQDELLFDGHSVVIDDEGEVIARAPGFEEALLVVDLDPVAAVGRRPARRPPPLARARPRRTTGAGARVRCAARASAPAAPGARAPTRRSRADAARTRARATRLRGEERLRRCRDRALGRDRLGVDRRARGGSARRRSGARRVDAVALLVAGNARRRRAARGVARDRLPRDRDRIGGRGVHGGARGVVRGTRGRSHGGEPAGEGTRHAADGALEQVRLAGARDRQQVGTVGRLLDALRRSGRRLRADQGRLQDGRLSPLALAERACGPRADPGVDHRARPDRRAARRPARRGLAAAVPPSSTASSRRTSSSTARATSWRRTASIRTWSNGRCR